MESVINEIIVRELPIIQIKIKALGMLSNFQAGYHTFTNEKIEEYLKQVDKLFDDFNTFFEHLHVRIEFGYETERDAVFTYWFSLKWIDRDKEEDIYLEDYSELSDVCYEFLSHINVDPMFLCFLSSVAYMGGHNKDFFLKNILMGPN